MNKGARPSASSTSRPASFAAALSSGSCSLRLASADWGPDVALPSAQAPASTIVRMRATPSLSSTSGMASIMAGILAASEAVEQAEHCRAAFAGRGPAAGDDAAGRVHIVADVGEVALVEQVLHVELHR